MNFCSLRTGIFPGILLCCGVHLQADPARIERGQVLYTQWCASCHGVNHQGGQAGALIEGEWNKVGKSMGFLEYVRDGDVVNGMPAFGDGLSNLQILDIAHYIADYRLNGARPGDHARPANTETHVGIGDHDFEIEEVFRIQGMPWGIDFAPSGNWGLITRREGPVVLFRDDAIVGPLEGTPEVLTGGQGGMMEVAFHPDYAQNGWIYLAYSHRRPGGGQHGMTRVVRGKLQGMRWVQEQTIYEAPADTYRNHRNHWGVRMVFREGYLYFGIGDRGEMRHAQDLSRPNGKIHRVHDDGRIPQDNPFVRQSGALDTIWAYGVRNPQGLDLHPLTGELWESEHGPRGGDEINLIGRGMNYGWPEITYGVNYNGTVISEKTHAPGMEQPKHQWTPSIAVCGIGFYEGDAFPNWRYNLFASSLAAQELHRLIIKDREVVDTEIILENRGRIRDVTSGPDGYLYLVMNGPSRIVRLKPE